MTRKTLYIVGTRSSNGEDYSLAYSKPEATQRIEDLLADGFDLSEIICLEGFQRSIRATTEMIVRNVRIV